MPEDKPDENDLPDEDVVAMWQEGEPVEAEPEPKPRLHYPNPQPKTPPAASFGASAVTERTAVVWLTVAAVFLTVALVVVLSRA